MGKAYTNRKKEKDRPESDFYETPYSLTWKLIELNEFDKNNTILEPSCGNYAISSQLIKNNFIVEATDLKYGNNFFNLDKKYKYIITNPPFSQFDNFVLKAKDISEKFAFIGKVNFFGAYNRTINNIWKNLKSIYIFNRQIDYRGEINEKGHFYVGNLVTGWFVWDKNWDKNYFETKIIDVQQFAKLGQLKK